MKPATIDQTIDAPQMTKEQFNQSMAGTVIGGREGESLSGKVQEFFETLKSDKDIAAHLARNPEYAKVLEQKVMQSYAKYESNLNAWSTKANTALKGLGVAGDAYFFYDPIGGLGIKFLSTAGRAVVELPNLINYVRKSGDYLSLGTFALMKAASYLPLATVADLGMKHIAAKGIKNEAKAKFLKEIGVPQESYLESLKKVYTGVVNRVKNVFTPAYEPSVQPA